MNSVVTQLAETGMLASADSIASSALTGAGQALVGLGVGLLTQGIDDPVISTVVNHVGTNFVSNGISTVLDLPGAIDPFSAKGLLGADFGGSMLGGEVVHTKTERTVSGRRRGYSVRGARLRIGLEVVGHPRCGRKDAGDQTFALAA